MAGEKKSPLLLIGAIVAIVVLAAGWFFTQGGGAPNQTAATTSSGQDAVADGEPLPDLFIGDADAPVEIIEYASFTCPHCASLARCGGELRYFGLVDLLFEKQSEWARGDGEAVVQNLYRIGRQAGLENDQMQACLQDRELSTALVEDFRLKAGKDDVNATPSFVINGQKYANSSWGDLKTVLDEKLN